MKGMVVKNKRIALIRLSYSRVYKLFDKIKVEQAIVPPMGLMSMGALLEKDGFKVKIWDCEAEPKTKEELIDELKEFKPLIVGLSCATPTYDFVKPLITEFRAILNIPVVLGGPHPSTRPIEVLLENPSLDYIIRKEGEFILLELANALTNNESLERIKGLTYRDKDGKIINNPDRELCDFNKLPMQAYHLVPNHLYKHSVPKKGMKKMAGIFTSRGCPNQCTFCYRLFGKGIRFRDPIKVIDEIEYVIKNLGVEWVTIYDDTFIIKKDHVFKICDEIKKRNLKFDWQCFVRANLVTEEIVDKLVSAGCKIISLGIESGNDDMLKKIKKGTNVEMIKRAVNIIRKFDVECRGSFIIGLPYETKETINDTLKLIKELPLHRINVNIATPYPGTEMFEQALKGEGLKLLSENWQEFTRHGNAVIETPKIKRNELIEYQKEALKIFYTRPDVLRYHLDQFIAGEKDYFYYRPIVFALKQIFGVEN